MILITGATGFVGAHLLKELGSGSNRIRLLIRPGADLSFMTKINPGWADNPAIETVEGDILDYYSLEDALENVETVYHIAGFISFRPQDRLKLMEVNGKGTANIINAALHKGVKRFVYMSSIAALGRSAREEIYEESRTWKNDPLNSWYAISKYSGEREAWRGCEEGLEMVIVNPSIILGHCRWHEGSGKIFSRIWKGMPYYTKGTTGYVDVKDVCSAMHMLGTSTISGERFILSAEDRSYKEMLTMIATALGKNPPSKNASRRLLKLVRIGEKLKTFFTGGEIMIQQEVIRNAFMTCRYPNTKITAATGFEFTPLQETIDTTAAVFKKEHPAS